MSEDNKNINTTEPTEDKKVNRLSDTDVLRAETVILDKNMTDEQFDKLFPKIEGARYSGSKQSSNGLIPDDSTPFEIVVPDLVSIAHRVQKTTVLTEGQKAFSTPLISNKMAIICRQQGKESIANLFITDENREDVKHLIRNGKGMAITTNWGDTLLKKDGTKNAKLELLPFENKVPAHTDAEITDAEILE